MTTSTMTSAPTEGRTEPSTSEGHDATSTATIRALARFEARRILRHPATLVGLALSTVLHAANTNSFQVPFHRGVDQPIVVLPSALARLPMHAAPLLVGLLIAVFLATSRARRHGAEEILDPAAMRPAGRTLAFVAAGTATTGLVVAWTGLAIAYVRSLDTIGAFAWGDVAQTLALGMLAHAAGVAAGTWLPTIGAFLLGLFGVAAMQVFLTAGQGGPEHTLAPVLGAPNHFLPEFVARPVGAHVVYLTGLAAVLGAVALLRHGTSGRRVLALAVGGLAVAIGVAHQYAARPTDADIAALVDLVEDPPLVCTGDDRVEACTLPAYAGIHAAWRTPTLAAYEALPVALRPETPIRIVQVLDRYDARQAIIDWFSWEDQQRLVERFEIDPSHDHDRWSGDVAWVDHGGAIVGKLGHWTDADGMALALEVTRRAVGIPMVAETPYTWTAEDVAWLRAQGFAYPDPAQDVPGDEQTPPEPGTTVIVRSTCYLGGQAREAVAVLLAATADPALEARLRWMVEDKPYFFYELDADGRVGSWYGASMWHLSGGGSAIDWSNAGAHAAARLLDVPDVRVTVLAEWERWTDPSADVNDLLARFGLDPLPSWQEHARANGLPVDDAGNDIDPLRYGGPMAFAPDDTPLPMRWQLHPCGGPPLGSFAR